MVCLCFTLQLAGQQAAKPKNQQAQQAQKQQQQQKVQQDKEAKKASRTSSPIREEIQRYFGYETLLLRYLTLPYDVTFNTNVPGYHIEGGFFMLLFLPIILLIGFRNKPLWGFLVILGCFGLLLISIPNSFIFDQKLQGVAADTESLSNYLSQTSFSEDPIGVIMASFYKAIMPIANPIEGFLDNISGSSDKFTYPLLMVLFAFIFLFIQTRIKDKAIHIKAIVNLLYLYGFLWFLMAAGIIWYGYLILPMSILLIIAAITKYKDQIPLLYKVSLRTFLVVGLLWIGMAHIVRTSNVYVLDNMTGKRLFDEPIVYYQTGQYTQEEVFEKYLPNVNSALAKLNRNDNELIYRVGTSLPFFIDKNDARVFSDNLLGFFMNIVKKYEVNKTIAEVLKANKFKYIVVNLNLASIDKTPEKSLERKFITFMTFLQNTEGIKLVATDRVLQVSGENNNARYQYGIEGQIYVPGTYAVYEIE